MAFQINGKTRQLVAGVVAMARAAWWRHAHGSRGHGRSHVSPALVPPYATVPVLGGRLALGTWQSICLVDPNGDVQNAYAIRSSQREFEAAAVQAVNKWKFKPGRKGGKDVPTHMQVPIVFTLNEE